jgi:hypothetical protein
MLGVDIGEPIARSLLRQLHERTDMAKRVQVIHTDDIDGSEAAETIAFALDGISYSIDLSTDNAKKLRDAFAPFIAAGERDRNSAARRTGSSRRKAAGTAATDIRAWAAAQGMQVSARGRVSAEVREAYERAHS